MKDVAVITGASRGIGAKTAALAAARGYDVCINYASDAVAAESVAEAVVACGQQAITVRADVAVEAQVCTLFETVHASLGRPTLLVNNAGILSKQMPLAQMSAARMERVLAVNVLGTLICAREAVRLMSTNNGGHGGNIVNVSSAAARLGSPGEYVDYAASKGALDTLTIGLAKEVAADGIRVNGVRPGFIYTDIHASGGEPARVERVKNLVPLKRGGQPEEVAEAIMWLASEHASYSTGTIIDVAGGN